MAEKRYTVANPKRINEGVRILHHGGQDYYEGDEFVVTGTKARPEVVRWLQGGYLVEVKDD